MSAHLLQKDLCIIIIILIIINITAISLRSFCFLTMFGVIIIILIIINITAISLRSFCFFTMVGVSCRNNVLILVNDVGI